MTLTAEQQLVERLKPNYQADKAAIEAAVQLRDQYPKLTEALNASIVANNALKSEAVAALSALGSRVSELTEALKPFSRLAAGLEERNDNELTTAPLIAVAVYAVWCLWSYWPAIGKWTGWW